MNLLIRTLDCSLLQQGGVGVEPLSVSSVVPRTNYRYRRGREKMLSSVFR